ncbi:MAG: sulfatase-like hydrolase/transferase [Phycisphaerales bacterium]|nr:sulfatase-like hydrolase/transferase [Phycisphaerales bacterium]
MHTDRDSLAKPTDPKRRRWSQLLLYAAAAIMIVVGGGSLLLKHFTGPARARTTGEIMPELVPVDHIAAAHGSLADWNVLIVSIDTLRADHVACYGNRSIDTPTLDGLAREGILCAQTITPVPSTLPAHSSLMTGLDPYHHGARVNGSFKLDDRNVTLAEILSEHGYRTGAIISAYVLDSTYGVGQGFEHYDDDLTHGVRYAPHMFRERPAELTNEAISGWLREHADERFFCWVHYFDPHALYLPPEPYRTEYARNPYDGEIAYVDNQLGKLLDLLSELGVRDKTLVIVTADHGEGLGEHNEMTHSLLVYDSTLHVPMIISAPGALPQGKVIGRQTNLIDVVPTVLDLLGIDAPAPVDGVSLLDQMAEPRACYIETLASKILHGWAPLMGVRREDHKFILAPRPEVYDLGDDPRELSNLYASRPEIAADLHELLRGFVGDDPLLAADVRQNMEMDEEAIRRLATLGYVMTVPEGGTETESLMDPKDGVIHWERVQEGTNRQGAGDIKGAIEILEACLEEVPGDVWARQNLASAYQVYGRYDDALVVLAEAERLAPSDPALPLATATLYTALGNTDEAEAKIQRALTLQPDNSGAHLQLAHIAILRHQPEQAMQLMNEALELDRGSRMSAILNSKADFHLRRGETEEARSAFEQALTVDALSGEAHAGLAEILISEGDEAAALKHLRTALRFNPVQPRALSVLAGIHINRGEYDEAIRCCGRVLEMSPMFGPAHGNLGLAHRRQGDLAQAEAVYRQGIEQCPGYDGLHQNLAQLLLKQNKIDEAAGEFREAVRINPYNAVALANFGMYNIQMSRPEAARRFLVRALQVKPDYAFAHKQLGLLLLDLGEPDAGAAHVRRSLEIDPDQVDAQQMRSLLPPSPAGP